MKPIVNLLMVIVILLAVIAVLLLTYFAGGQRLVADLVMGILMLIPFAGTIGLFFFAYFNLLRYAHPVWMIGVAIAWVLGLAVWAILDGPSPFQGVLMLCPAQLFALALFPRAFGCER